MTWNAYLGLLKVNIIDRISPNKLTSTPGHLYTDKVIDEESEAMIMDIMSTEPFPREPTPSLEKLVRRLWPAGGWFSMADEVKSRMNVLISLKIL